LNQYSQLEDKFDSEYNNHEIDNNDFRRNGIILKEVDPWFNAPASTFWNKSTISTFWIYDSTDSTFWGGNEMISWRLENQNWWENSKNILIFITTIFIVIVFIIIRLIKRKK